MGSFFFGQSPFFDGPRQSSQFQLKRFDYGPINHLRNAFVFHDERPIKKTPPILERKTNFKCNPNGPQLFIVKKNGEFQAKNRFVY